MGTFDRARRNRRHAGWGGEIGGKGHPPGGPIRPLFGDNLGFDHKPDYKTAALCKQVRRIVSMTLSGECGDPVLQSLIVDDVLPAPSAGRLLVRLFLRAAADAPPPSVIDVLERLAKVEGLLRTRVGESIARKRTPELAFDVIPVGLSPGNLPPEVHHD